MSRIETLSRERSPFLDRGGIEAFLGSDKRVRVHADADALRAIRDELFRIACREYGRLFAHARQHDLRTRVDHYVAVYVCGYEYAQDGHDDAGRSFPWRTGTGSYSGADARRDWSGDLQAALMLVGQKCPALRIDIRYGGSGRGVRAARLSRKHPVPALAGAPVRLPDPMPSHFRSSPAAGVLYVLLEALAMEKEAGHPYPARLSGREAA